MNLRGLIVTWLIAAIWIVAMNVLIGAYWLLFSMEYEHERVLCHADSSTKIEALVAKAGTIQKWRNVRLTPTTAPPCTGHAIALEFLWTGSPWINYRQSETFRRLAESHEVQVLQNRYTMEVDHSGLALTPALIMTVLAVIFLRLQRRKARWIKAVLPRFTTKLRLALGVVSGGLLFASILPLIAMATASEFQVPTYPVAGSYELGWASIIALVIAIPVFEEVIFRGWLLEAWSGFINPVAALIISSILFSAIHPAGLLINSLLFLCGMVFGLLWLQTRSVVAPIAAHSTYNAMVLLLA